MKRMLLVMVGVVLAMGVWSCSKSMTNEQYIKAMSTLGCKGVMENSPAAADIFKEQGITLQDIQNFRKNMKAGDATTIANEIVKRVGECHGVKM